MIKTTEEILIMLVSELSNRIGKIISTKQKLRYYNETLGDTSFLLAGLLESLLKKKFNDWDSKNWIDDSLITTIETIDNKLMILGIMIYGKEDTTEQWTAPFHFEIEMIENKINLNAYTFLFFDLANPEVSYEEFKMNRNYWNTNCCDWKYIINSD